MPISESQPYLHMDPQVVLEIKEPTQIKNIKKWLFMLNMTETEMTTLFKKVSIPAT
jgi:hypothetical protein